MRLNSSVFVFLVFGPRNSEELSDLDRCRSIISFVNVEEDRFLSEMNEENCQLKHSDDGWHPIDYAPVFVSCVQFGVLRQSSSKSVRKK